MDAGWHMNPLTLPVSGPQISCQRWVGLPNNTDEGARIGKSQGLPHVWGMQSTLPQGLTGGQGSHGRGDQALEAQRMEGAAQ